MNTKTSPVEDAMPSCVLAAVIYTPGQGVDTLLAQVAARLTASGHRLAGLVQYDRGTCEGPDFTMALQDLASGQNIPISLPQSRESHACRPESRACRLDPAGLAQGATVFKASLVGDIDLVILNKFGRQEVLGRGLRDEIAAAVLTGCPVVIAVRSDLVDAWRAFVGDDWAPLAPDPDVVEHWCRAQMANARSVGALS